jgi:hypothetical protein
MDAIYEETCDKYIASYLVTLLGESLKREKQDATTFKKCIQDILCSIVANVEFKQLYGQHKCKNAAVFKICEIVKHFAHASAWAFGNASCFKDLDCGKWVPVALSTREHDMCVQLMLALIEYCIPACSGGSPIQNWFTLLEMKSLRMTRYCMCDEKLLQFEWDVWPFQAYKHMMCNISPANAYSPEVYKYTALLILLTLTQGWDQRMSERVLVSGWKPLWVRRPYTDKHTIDCTTTDTLTPFQRQPLFEGVLLPILDALRQSDQPLVQSVAEFALVMAVGHRMYTSETWQQRLIDITALSHGNRPLSELRHCEEESVPASPHFRVSLLARICSYACVVRFRTSFERCLHMKDFPRFLLYGGGEIMNGLTRRCVLSIGSLGNLVGENVMLAYNAEEWGAVEEVLDPESYSKFLDNAAISMCFEELLGRERCGCFNCTTSTIFDIISARDTEATVGGGSEHGKLLYTTLRSQAEGLWKLAANMEPIRFGKSVATEAARASEGAAGATADASVSIISPWAKHFHKGRIMPQLSVQVLLDIKVMLRLQAITMGSEVHPDTPYQRLFTTCATYIAAPLVCRADFNRVGDSLHNTIVGAMADVCASTANIFGHCHSFLLWLLTRYTDVHVACGAHISCGIMTASLLVLQHAPVSALEWNSPRANEQFYTFHVACTSLLSCLRHELMTHVHFASKRDMVLAACKEIMYRFVKCTEIALTCRWLPLVYYTIALCMHKSCPGLPAAEKTRLIHMPTLRDASSLVTMYSYGDDASVGGGGDSPWDIIVSSHGRPLSLSERSKENIVKGVMGLCISLDFFEESRQQVFASMRKGGSEGMEEQGFEYIEALFSKHLCRDTSFAVAVANCYSADKDAERAAAILAFTAAINLLLNAVESSWREQAAAENAVRAAVREPWRSRNEDSQPLFWVPQPCEMWLPYSLIVRIATVLPRLKYIPRYTVALYASFCQLLSMYLQLCSPNTMNSFVKKYFLSASNFHEAVKFIVDDAIAFPGRSGAEVVGAGVHSNCSSGGGGGSDAARTQPARCVSDTSCSAPLSIIIYHISTWIWQVECARLAFVVPA